MKIQNADSRDYPDLYEVHIICRNETEFNKAYDNIDAADFDFDLEHWGDEIDVISVTCDPNDYETKEQFITDIRKTAKR